MDQTNKDLSGATTELNDLSLYLKWDTRDTIINSLNQFSALLMGKQASNDQKNKIKNDNNSLILMLSNLPLRSNDEEEIDTEEETPRKKIKLENDLDSGDSNKNNHRRESSASNQTNSDELFLELHPKTRLKIINHLITNKCFAVSFAHIITIDKKKSLVKENKALINELLDLNIAADNPKPIDFEDDLMLCGAESPANGMTNGNNRNLISRHEIDDLSVNLKTEISELRAAIRTEISEFTERFDKFKEETSKQVQSNSIDRDSVEFTFELGDVEKFLLSSTPRFSEIFYCRSIPWCLSVQVMEKTDQYRTRFLGFYLRCENTNDFTKWRCVTDAELKLISQLPDIHNNYFRQQYNVTKAIKTTFARVPPVTIPPTVPGASSVPLQSSPNLSVYSNGFNDFIAIDKLRDLKNGFIKNDTIKLACTLKAEKVIRMA